MEGRTLAIARRGHRRPRPGPRASTALGEQLVAAARARARARGRPVPGDLPRRPACSTLRAGAERHQRGRPSTCRALARTRTFDVTARLRFYETRAFLPSARPRPRSALVGLGLAGPAPARRRRAVRRRFNPYIAGAPVMNDEMFFGRQKLLARILNVLHHNSLMITGERRIGKTTLPLPPARRRWRRTTSTEYRFFPVFTDLQGVPEEAFFHAMMSDVVEQLGSPPGDDGLPALPAARRSRYDGRDFSHDLQRVVERAEDAHAAAREAGPADRRGGRAQRVLRAHQPAAAQHLHEDVLRAPGRDHERRRHQAASGPAKAAPGTTSSTRSSSPPSRARRRRR